MLEDRRPVAQAHRQGGLPEPLQNGIEMLSGVAMDQVKVHRNSSQPAMLNALAYAQGNDIHLASGQRSAAARRMAWYGRAVITTGGQHGGME